MLSTLRNGMVLTILVTAIAYGEPNALDVFSQLERLNLNATQEKQLGELKESLKAEDAQAKEGIQEAKRNLRRSLREDIKEEGLWEAFHAQQEMLRRRAEKRFSRILEIRRILNADQRKFFPPPPPRPKPKSGGLDEASVFGP